MLPSILAFFTPESGGSPNANQIDTLYKITLVIALIIFFAVEGGLGYALIKFRKRKGAVAAQIHGNTRLEIGWTAASEAIGSGFGSFGSMRSGILAGVRSGRTPGTFPSRGKAP